MPKISEIAKFEKGCQIQIGEVNIWVNNNFQIKNMKPTEVPQEVIMDALKVSLTDEEADSLMQDMTHGMQVIRCGDVHIPVNTIWCKKISEVGRTEKGNNGFYAGSLGKTVLSVPKKELRGAIFW